MRYTKLFSKTTKNVKENVSVNAALLQKAGYIDQIMAGVYAFLPIGLRVVAKIEAIVRGEIDTIGSEMRMPALAPAAIWQQTGRLETVDVLMKTQPANAAAKAKNDTEYILNCTHEDVVTYIAQKYNLSYKDFPFAVYQIQTKFRNEPRAKSGLLRCREFVMKDLYSFHTSIEDFKKYYEESKTVYMNIYKKIGIAEDTYLTMASGGDFTEDYSHEFQTVCDAGEDIIFHDEKTNQTFNREIAPSKAPEFKQDEEMQEMKEVEGAGIIGVEALAKFLNIPVEKTTKTILFEDENGRVIAAAVRGDYDINEDKLKRVLGIKKLALAKAETVKKVTQAEVGYAGILNLPEEVTIVMDDSLKGRINFEMGANKTHYHSINVNFGRDLKEPETFYDIKTAKTGDLFPETGAVYKVMKASEVGNIFPLYTKFTKAFNYTFKNEKGEEQPIYMGSYGIGITRLMGVLVEKFHDDRGIIWPESVAPFKVYLAALDLKDEALKKQAEEVYKKVRDAGIEVLFDDRVDVSAGAKFADADLMGIPHRMVISKRLEGKVEYKARTEKEAVIMSLDEIIQKLSV